MKSIVTTYPDFQSLPKAIKQMLVASESHFFELARPATFARAGQKPSYAPSISMAEARLGPAAVDRTFAL